MVRVAYAESRNSLVRKASNASRLTGSNWPKPCIQTDASFRASGSSLHHFTRPRRSWVIRPARVRMDRCLLTAVRGAPPRL